MPPKPLRYWSLTHIYTTPPLGLECSPMARETGVQSQVESYQRLKKWYLMPPCLALSIIRYGSRVKWSNLGKRVAHFLTLRCSIENGAFGSPLTIIANFTYIYIYIYIYITVLVVTISIRGFIADQMRYNLESVQ